MKISSRPPAMAGAVVPAQLYSGRPRESGTHRAANSGLSNMGPRLRGDDTMVPVSRSRRWLLRLVSSSRPSVSLSRFVSCSPSFHLHLSSPAPPSRRGPLSFALPPSNEGRRSAGAGHWHSRRACEARRLASRATGGRLSALHVAIFGCETGASSSGSAHRNPRRDFAHGRALTPDRSGPHLPRPRFAPPPRDATPRCALKAPPAAPRTSEVMRNVAIMRYVVK
jgi:hypothetical protein